MIYIIGDLHGNLQNLKNVLEQIPEPTEFSYVICAGDVGLEYGDWWTVRNYKKNSRKMKKLMQDSGLCWFIMRGNHDNRYWATHYPKQVEEGWTLTDQEDLIYENEFPHIFYLRDEGGTFQLAGKRFLFVPGAYSVDKFYRLERGLSWNKDEQLTEREMMYLFWELECSCYNVDYVVSHTYPRGLENKIQDLFLPGLDQSSVDKSMENFLEQVRQTATFKHWYFGHLHDDREIDGKYTMLYHKVAVIDPMKE